MTKQYEQVLSLASSLSRTELLALMATVAEALAKQDSVQLDTQWQTQPHWEELNQQQPEQQTATVASTYSHPVLSFLGRGLTE